MAETQAHSEKSVLVTGASSGIGKATATRLAADGADIVLAARSEAEIDSLATDLAEQHNITSIAVPVNVRQEDAVEEMIATAIECLDGLDAAIVNAGVGCGSSDVTALETDDYRQMMETNVDGAFFTTRAVLPQLRAHSGNLVYIGSIASHFPHVQNPVYAATKAWLRSFANSIEAQTGPDGVAVTIINPGTVRTPFAFDTDPSQEKKFPEGTAIEPREIADLISQVLDSETGTTISEINIHRRDQLQDFAIQ